MKKVASVALLLLCVASVLMPAARAKVARVSLADLAQSSDVIVLARVERIFSYDGLPVAMAAPTQALKGDPGDRALYFVAGKTWACDVSAGVRRDPPRLLLARFAGHKPEVKPQSRSDQGPYNNGVIDRETGARGIEFWTGSLKWLSAREVRMDGGYYFNSRGAMAATYRLRHRRGGWVVLGTIGPVMMS